MKFVSLPEAKFTRLYIVSLILSALLAMTAFAQTAQLSLADILIALRSKKVTLEERNKILSDAVKQRGITFALTPEIEKELVGGGADKELIEAIRQKSPVVKPAATPQPTPVPVATPIPTPTPPDFTFYQKRGNAYVVSGNIELAVSDFSRAIELNPKEISLYMSRGRAFYNKKDFEQAIADYGRAIELNPKELMAYINRAESYEKIGDAQKALADYKKASELDASNETAKTSVQRLQAELSKPNPTPPVQETTEAIDPTRPVNLGQLNNIAVRLSKPIYPGAAQKANVQGVVTVQVTIDEQGEVISAKATSGHGLLRSVSEDAARKSKFKPATVDNKPVKATGVVVYNFVNQM